MAVARGEYEAAATRGARALSTITRWNSLERQGHRSSRDPPPACPSGRSGLDDPGIFRVLLDRWSKLRPDDERNLGFNEAADLLNLDAEERRRLKAAGVKDLRGIARALRSAPVLERQNAGARALRKVLDERQRETPSLADIEFSEDIDVGRLQHAVAAGLASKGATKGKD